MANEHPLPFIGEIRIFAGNFAPRGWALCQGQTLSVEQNSNLFSIIGTTYGGDGKKAFQLPDLRGRFPIGMGQAIGAPTTYLLGDKGAFEQPTPAENASFGPPIEYLAVNYIIALTGVYPDRS